jgi:hypothetical protein
VSQPEYTQYPRYRQADISMSLIGDAWDYVKNNMGTYVGFTAILMIAGTVGSLILQGPSAFQPDMDNPYKQYSMPSYYIAQLFSTLLNYFLVAGVTTMALKELGGQRATLADGFGVIKNSYWMVALTMFLTTLMVFAGIGCLIIPGIILGVLTMAAVPAVIDQRMTTFEALSWSFQNTKKYFWQILGLMIVGGIVVILGVCLCCVGVFATFPIYLILVAMVYHQLRWEETGGQMMTASPYPGGAGLIPSSSETPRPDDMGPQTTEDSSEPPPPPL